MEMRKVKEEPEDVDDTSADVFEAKEVELKEECLLVKPEILAEEEALKSKGEEDYAKELEKNPDEDLSEEERFQKLQKLLKESKLYSDFLLDKMRQSEEDRAKGVKKADKKKKRKVDRDDAPIAKRQRRASRTFNGQSIPDEQPLLISGGIMRSYQLEGLQWMMNLDQNGINGILADEMGLGKTIQTISLFAHLIELGVRGPFLIIAPLSTISNWCKEVQKFAPQMPVVLYHGSAAERQELRRLKLNESNVIEGVFHEDRLVKNVFVTSYEIAINDRAYLRSTPWRYIVVDEGHRLKNTNCRLIKELKTYSSANRLLLTGTPLQNNLDELWSLLNFLMPEIFDDVRVFRSWFKAEDLHGNNEDERKRIIQQERQGSILATLHQVLTPFLLRRVKADVDLDIPGKKELLVYCPMTSWQNDFYTATVNRTLAEMVGEKEAEDDEIEKSPVNGKRQRKKQQFDYKLILDAEDGDSDDDLDSYFESLRKIEDRRKYELASAYKVKMSTTEIRVSLKNRMMDLRKITNHPYLIEYPLTNDGVYYLIDDNVVEKSGKMKVLDQMLTELLKRGHKVLIFSQMTRMLDILGDYLNHKGLTFSRLDGSMDFKDRQENIDQFNETDKTNIFLLSTRAGGLGINLTAADTCIIFDSDWNPQQDLQAQDRCHRIGQTKPVVVYRLVTANTIDEKIVERAAAKRKLEKLVIHRNKFKSQDLSGLKTTLEAISPQELLDLLNSKDHAGVFDRRDGEHVFSETEMEALLDRSDLVRNASEDKENKKKKSKKGKGQATKVKEEPSIFKVVDTEGMSGSQPLDLNKGTKQ